MMYERKQLAVTIMGYCILGTGSKAAAQVPLYLVSNSVMSAKPRLDPANGLGTVGCQMSSLNKMVFLKWIEHWKGSMHVLAQTTEDSLICGILHELETAGEFSANQRVLTENGFLRAMFGHRHA